MRFAGTTASVSLTFYKWKSIYGGLDVQQLANMKELQKGIRVVGAHA